MRQFAKWIRLRSNAHTLFGLARIPCDNHIRQLLDGVPTTQFDHAFHALVEDLDADGGLAPMRRLEFPLAPVHERRRVERRPPIPLAQSANRAGGFP